MNSVAVKLALGTSPSGQGWYGLAEGGEIIYLYNVSRAVVICCDYYDKMHIYIYIQGPMYVAAQRSHCSCTLNDAKAAPT